MSTPNPYGPPGGFGGQHYGPGMPDKQVGWVVAAFLLFWPVGIFALLESNKIEECWRRGDLIGAQQASGNTKKIGQWTLYISLGLCVLGCVLGCALPALLGVGMGFCGICGIGSIGAASSG